MAPLHLKARGDAWSIAIPGRGNENNVDARERRERRRLWKKAVSPGGEESEVFVDRGKVLRATLVVKENKWGGGRLGEHFDRELSRAVSLVLIDSSWIRAVSHATRQTYV